MGLRRSYGRGRTVITGFDRPNVRLAVFGFNLFGDAHRDVLDPKLRLQ